MDKNYILEHIEDFTNAAELADFIQQGMVTLVELKKTNKFDASLRNTILKILNTREQESKKEQAEKELSDNVAWESVRYSPEFVISDWIYNNPNNLHIQEAKDRIEFLQKERESKDGLKQEILKTIRSNPNTYSPYEIRTLLNSCTLTEQDLLNCGIPQSAIDNLDRVRKPNLILGNTPTSIPDGYSEVYFWGTIGSGKTCALGAILHLAEQKGYLSLAPSDGYKYATQLKNIFSEDGEANSFLPSPTPEEVTQYLPLTLQKTSERKRRSVSLIEISGGIFQCFSKVNGKELFDNKTQENTFNSLCAFLKSKNRKIHFFFIDYKRYNKADGNDNRQSDYLAAAATYFKEAKIFNKTTDAIYVVLTKSDLMLSDNSVVAADYDRCVELAKHYLNSEKNNYKSLIRELKDICIENSINGGKLTVEPFSLGKVYFQDICNFNGNYAENIVDILMDRIVPTGKSLFDIFNK